ncbi:MAG: VOC family protein [Candidatus Binatia bacterium]|nr:VOC family protein [Candidatus Binatia bacterium]
MSRHLGQIRQNDCVVRYIEAAMKHWAEVLGGGPFFYIERVPVEDFRYRGAQSDVDISIALSSSGPLQIERIQPRNEAPSLWSDFLMAGNEGL